LRNVLERVVVETEAEAIGARAFAEWIQERQRFAPQPVPSPQAERSNALPVIIPYRQSAEGQVLEADLLPARTTRGQRAELTTEQIKQAFRATEGNLSAAARLLGVHRATLYRHLDRLNLDRNSLSQS